MHVELAGYHAPATLPSVLHSMCNTHQGRPRPGRKPSSQRQTTRSASPTCRRSGVKVQRGPIARRHLAQVPQGRGSTSRTRLGASTWGKYCATLAPRCWCRTCPWVAEKATALVCGASDSRLAAPSSTACRCSSPRALPGSKRFAERGLPIIGDDIKSQVGATIVHRVLTDLFRKRGVKARPHLPAQLRRQHRLPQHAGARAARCPRRSPRRRQ
jgi:hypothetical protein